ncbi:MAG TPA: hypothetical protein VHS96_09950 [Bacteroidia bacterium]|nr:hypothetical protein [Bacteroidia bacterium]
MAKVKIELTGEVELEFDEKSKEFTEALEGYCEVIDPFGKIDDMLKHVAFSVNKFGVDKMVEGVGYVAYKYTKRPKQPYSGIVVIQTTLEFDLDLMQLEKI